MKIWDRKRNIFYEEKEYGKKKLDFLYNTFLGRILLKLIFSRVWFSKLQAIYQNSKISKRKILPFILKYNVEGETNMPFVLSKISIISQSLGTDKTVEGMRWAFDVNETNDIYLYIDKNEGNNQEELIKSVKIDSMNVNIAPTIGQTNFYKPDITDVNLFFKDSAENVINSLEYAGDVESDIKNLKISNQGGIVAFRYSINNVAEYTSNDDEQIEHKDLLNKAGVDYNNLKSNISFDLTINLESGKVFKSNINLDLPLDNVVQEGVVSKEITDVEQFIFKRIQN